MEDVQAAIDKDVTWGALLPHGQESIKRLKSTTCDPLW